MDQLRSENPHWNEEQLYQAARALNEAEWQKVVYDEYLPARIGVNALSEYGGYDSHVDPSIINEFTTVAFRFGHDTVSETQLLVTEDGQPIPIPLSAVFSLANTGQGIRTNQAAGDWARGQLSQFSQEVDGRINGTLRETLFSVPAPADIPGADPDALVRLNLPGIDILRGRDHGVSDYNKLRSELGLSTYHSFEDFAYANDLDYDRLAALKSVYSDDISQLDSIVGGLLEVKAPWFAIGRDVHETVCNAVRSDAIR